MYITFSGENLNIIFEHITRLLFYSTEQTDIRWISLVKIKIALFIPLYYNI